MKKIRCGVALTAAMLSLIPMTVLAQDSVRLYGIVDAGVGTERITYKGKSYSRTGLQTGGSRFGLIGSHDLGDGYGISFQLENGVNVLNGGGGGDRIFGRMATLAVNHPRYGKLEAGRHYNLAALYQGEVDPFGGGYDLSGSDTTISSGKRLDNLLVYTTPNVSGFEGGIGYSFGADDFVRANENKKRIEAAKKDDVVVPSFYGDHKHDRFFTTGLKYAVGPVKAIATYDIAWRRKDADDKKKGDRIDAYILGASYDLGDAVTVYGNFAQTVGGWIAAKNMSHMPGDEEARFGNLKFAKGFRARSGMVGASYKNGPHLFMASWQRAHANNTKLTKHKAPFNVYAVAHRYALSKRTHVRSHVSYATNYAFVHGLKGTVVNTSVRHFF